MTDSPNAPQPSPAAMLAGVLRIIRPYVSWYVDRRGAVLPSPADTPEGYLATSLDDLARVVAMLDGAQRERFKDAFADAFIRADPRCCVDLTWEAFVATPAQILAALVAAVGFGAEGEGR